MSFLKGKLDQTIEMFKDPLTTVFFVIGIAVALLFKFVFNQGWVFAIIAGLIVFGFIYMLYNDIEQRKQQAVIENKNKEAIVEKIKAQREKDVSKNTCVSCTAKIPEGATECPNCGFSIKKITDREIKVDIEDAIDPKAHK